MTRRLSLEVHGREKSWLFEFEGDPANIPEWEADGLSVVVLENTIPESLPSWAKKIWALVQDLWNFRFNPREWW